MRKWIPLLLVCLLSTACATSEKEPSTNEGMPRQVVIETLDRTRPVYCDSESYSLWFAGDTVRLSDGQLLYYRYDCEEVALLKRNTDGEEMEIISMSGFHPRIMHSFMREYSDRLLFRCACGGGGGSCEYVLVDKVTGQELEYIPYLVFASVNPPLIVYFNGNDLSRALVYDVERRMEGESPVDIEDLMSADLRIQFSEGEFASIRDSVISIPDNYYGRDTLTIDLKRLVWHPRRSDER